MPRPLPIPLTYEDYLGFPDDGKRHEILEGEHVMTPAPAPRHQSVVATLTHLLLSFLEEHPVGRAWPAPIDVMCFKTASTPSAKALHSSWVLYSRWYLPPNSEMCLNAGDR